MRSGAPGPKAFIANALILLLWYALEYAQFGRLETGRACDTVVFLCYAMLTYFLFQKSEKNL